LNTFFSRIISKFAGPSCQPSNGDIHPKWSAVSKLWETRAAELIENEKPTSWTDSPLVQQMYIHPLISGRANIGWLESVSEKYFTSPVSTALSLGCGGGGLERHAADLKIAQNFVAYDVSEGAIELAKNLAKKRGLRQLTYRVADLNTLVHPENNYDVVFASQSLHHIESLEFYLDQVERTLKPNGLFIINEFVGPNQFQWTDLQVRHAQLLLETIPERYRQIIQGHGLKTEIARPSIEFMNQIDPTEAIRSAEIIQQVSMRFETIEKIDFGGTLLQLVLADIVGNFSDTPEDRAILQNLFDEEQRLLQSGELESDFILMVMRNKK
jgi:ubiquinone/menaquinone biosynthesis C-methylase UbiE